MRSDPSIGKVRYPRGRVLARDCSALVLLSIAAIHFGGCRAAPTSAQSTSRYTVREVEFRNGDVTLAGTVFLPDAADVPGVVLIHGSGAATREGLRYYGEALAAEGIAVLAYDKRGTGRSEGNWRLADFRVLADDALAGHEFLTTVSSVDTARVGLMGQSQGGWIAPLAASISPDVAFLITVSGPGVSPAEQVGYQWFNRFRNAGATDEQARQGAAMMARVNAYLVGREGWEAVNDDLKSLVAEKVWFRATLEEHGVWTELPSSSALDTIRGWRSPPLRNWHFDPVELLGELSIPVLVVYGRRDELVPVERSLARVQGTLVHRDSAVRVFEDANHWIRVQRGPAIFSRPALADGYLDLLAGWINGQSHPNRITR